MKKARLLGGAAAIGALALVVVAATHAPVRGSVDLHETTATVAHPATDITDTYLFPSPNNPNNVVVVMDVNPFATVNSFFDNAVLYQMKFDTKYANGQEAAGTPPAANLVIQFSASAPSNGTQIIYVYGPATPNESGTTNTTVSPVTQGFFNKSFQANGITVFAGVREDPSAFDYDQFTKIFPDRANSTAASCLPTVGDGTCPLGFNNPGVDKFAADDVLSIVVELPRSTLEPSGTGPKITYWATTNTVSGK